MSYPQWLDGIKLDKPYIDKDGNLCSKGKIYGHVEEGEDFYNSKEPTRFKTVEENLTNK